jgi:hypothetical protein
MGSILSLNEPSDNPGTVQISAWPRPLTRVTHRGVSDHPGESVPAGLETVDVGRPWVVYGFSSTDRRRSVYTFTPTFDTGTKIMLFSPSAATEWVV